MTSFMQLIVAQIEHPFAAWTFPIAVLGLVVSLVVGIYSAWSARKSAREVAELANWPAMVAALQAEVTRLRATHEGDIEHYEATVTQIDTRLTALERENEDRPWRSS
jgi:hypothetical protein